MAKHAKKTQIPVVKIIIAVGTLLLIAGIVLAYIFFGLGTKRQLPEIIIKKTGTASGVDFNKPVRILVLGSDSRNSNIKGSRSDANMLVQINPDKTADIVSFPRDSFVPIACGGTGKINSALALGGSECTVKTVENYSGLKVHYYMVASFPRFTGIINTIGGLKFHFEEPLNDRMAGANFSAGTKKLKGGEALAVARARHIAGGDFSRQGNQQKLAIAAFNQERNRATNMSRILRLVQVLSKRVTTNISNQELFQLIRMIFRVEKDKIKATVLKGGTGGGGGASVVHLDKAFADKIFAEMKNKE